MKKILFISFYWPPSGKASLHWPLKMIKYLPEYNWQSSVLTANEDTFSDEDNSLLKDIDSSLEVIKTNFFDPFTVYKKILGKDTKSPLIASEAMSKTNKSLRHKISLWIRLNLFIPDARVGWYLPAVKAASEYLRNNKIDAIISNGPPHTSHLIGMKLSKKFNIPLISVFIDPWVDIAYYKGQKRNKLALIIDNRFEKSVMRHSSKIIFVTKTLEKYFLEKYPFVNGKSEVLYWGYNEEDFNSIKKNKTQEKILLHAGNIFDYQNPKMLWKTIKKRIDGGDNLKIRFIGTVSPAVKNSIKQEGLETHTEYLGFLPYDQAVQQMINATYLLVCATEPRHFPGKLFEYMRAGNPILAFGDDNFEVQSVLEETNSGMLFRYNDSAESFFKNADMLKTDLEKVKQFDRKVIAEKLSKVLFYINK